MSSTLMVLIIGVVLFVGGLGFVAAWEWLRK